MNSKRLSELRYKGHITDSEYKELKLAIKAYEKRPQGEWIEKIERRGCFAGDKTVYSYTCPFCGAKEFKKYPFCHCGADMRVKDELKEAENEDSN